MGEKIASERFSEKEFYEQSLIDIMGILVYISLETVSDLHNRVEIELTGT